jgi:stearoyl-CoA desaturase (delta-9 desaturase)
MMPNLLAVVLFPFFGWPTWIELLLFLLGWLVTSIGISVGFHRLFTHKAFKTYDPVECILAVAGMMAAVGPLVSWVAIHRRHHEKSDVSGDPHSPIAGSSLGGGPRGKVIGLLHAQFGWMWHHEYPNPLFYARDLLRKQQLVVINRSYPIWVLGGILLPGALNFATAFSTVSFLRGIYFGGILRIVVVQHLTSSINSVCHYVGARRYRTADDSTNCWWLAIPTLGEAWHNNHHASQISARFGHAWWEIDLGSIVISACRAIGIVWDVRVPSVGQRIKLDSQLQREGFRNVE